MEVVKTRKIGESIGIIFPMNILPEVGEIFSIYKLGDTYILKPIKDDIFKNDEDWVGFRESIEKSDLEWDLLC
ncbi:antitoxin MazE [Enterococcus faecalis]